MYLPGVMRAATREVGRIVRARTTTHRRLRDTIVAIAVATIGIDVICGVLAFIFEHHAKQTQINSFPSALFWTSTQLLTVSSSLKNPISTSGRILDVAMEAYAIVVISSLAGAIGAFLVKRAHELERSEKTSPDARHRDV